MPQQTRIVLAIVALLGVGVLCATIILSGDENVVVPAQPGINTNSPANTETLQDSGRPPTGSHPRPLPPMAQTPVSSDAILDATIVEGAVTDESGKPVSGARIRIEGNGQLSRFFGQAASSVDGQYSTSLKVRACDPYTAHLDRPVSTLAQDGSFRLSVVAEGYVPVRDFAVTIKPRQTNFLARLALKAAAILRGTVVDSANIPVEDAIVRLFRDPKTISSSADRFTRKLGQEVMSVRSGPDGRFLFDEAPEGEALLVAEAPTSGEAFALLTLPASKEVSMSLQPGAAIFGVLLDGLGNGVRRAQVTLRLRDRPPLAILRAKTDDRGRFGFFNLESGVYELSASFLFFSTVLNDVTPSVEPVTITLDEGASISGRVFDGASGAPVENFAVSAFPIRDERDINTLAANDGPPHFWPGGGFRLPLLMKGNYIVRVRADGYQCADSRIIQLSTTTHTEGVVFKLQRDTPVTGSIAYAQGLDGPITSIPVQAFEMRKIRAVAAAATAGSSVTELLPTQNLRPASACISDLDGRFELRGLGPGEYLIVARQEYQLAESFVTIESNEAPDRVDLVFAAPGALRIHVLDTRTLPLSGVGVYLARCDGADISGISGTSDHNGMIEIDGLSPGEYVVKPTAAGVLDGAINSPHRVIVAAGRNAEFEIVLPALVELHLLVLVDGVPLATESVSLRHGTSASQKGRTDETGAANFKGVIPGAVRLTYEKAGKKWEASLDIPNDPLQSLNADLQPMD